MMYGVGILVLFVLGWWFLREKPQEEVEPIITKANWVRIEWCDKCLVKGENVCPECGEEVVFRTARRVYNTAEIFPKFIEWELKPCDTD